MASIVDPDPDGKSEPPECATCGKRQWPVIHSCTGVRQPTAPPDLLERVARALFDEWNERLMDGSFTWDPHGVIAGNMRREAAVVLRWAVVRKAVARGLGVDL